TPLIVAAQASAIRAIASLTALGADADAQDATGNTALHYAVINSSERAMIRSHMEITDRDGNTPFMAAVRYDSSRMVQYFLQIGYRPDKKEKNGNTPLHPVGCRGRHWQRNGDGYFMASRCRPQHHIDKAGNTLLLLACAGPSIVILKHVLEHCSEVRTHNVAGDTALHLASVAKGPNVIFDLCKRGANVTAQDCLGRTPLMIAIMSSNRQAA
ncbi:hypothetical protein DAPPUDRAFT_14305, partial [Daphnia pulex]